MSKELPELQNWLLVRAADSRCAGPPNASSELSYDWLLCAAVESVMVLETATGSIVEANPAAALLLGTPRAALIGSHLQAAFERSSAPPLTATLAAALATGSARTAGIRTLDGESELGVALSLIHSDTGAYLLVHLTLTRSAGAAAIRSRASSVVLDVIDSAPLGFLITDARLHVEYANRAFIEMIELEPGERLRGEPLLEPGERLRGEPLARWLELSSVDLRNLQAQMARRQAATLLTCKLHPVRHAARDVEVCAVAVPDGGDTCWGFSIRDRPRMH